MLTTIVIRIVICTRPGPDIYAPSSSITKPVLEKAIDYSQTVTLVFSFLTNTLATLIVGLEAWKHRQFVRKEIRLARAKNLRGEKILVLLVESGLLYCISGVGRAVYCYTDLIKIQAALLICSLVRMPLGRLGDVYTPVNVQIAVSGESVVRECISFDVGDISSHRPSSGRVPEQPRRNLVRDVSATIGRSHRLQNSGVLVPEHCELAPAERALLWTAKFILAAVQRRCEFNTSCRTAVTCRRLRA